MDGNETNIMCYGKHHPMMLVTESWPSPNAGRPRELVIIEGWLSLNAEHHQTLAFPERWSSMNAGHHLMLVVTES